MNIKISQQKTFDEATRKTGVLRDRGAAHDDFTWPTLLQREAAQWRAARAAAAGGPRILIANAMASDPGAPNVENTLAVALTLRGAEVHVLRCDQALPACCVSHIDHVDAEEFANVGPKKSLCEVCFHGARTMFDPLGIPTYGYSELLTDEERKEARELSSIVPLERIRSFRLDGMAIGEHAMAGALRFFSRGNIDREPHGEAILRRYLDAALLTVFALRRLFDRVSFACVSTLHGIYVPEGVIGEVARSRNVRVVDWSVAYRKQSFIFSHTDTYHRTLLEEPTTEWEDMPWTAEMESRIVDYLKSRFYGTHDWVKVSQPPQEDLQAIADEIGIDFGKPSIGLLTNVMWDAQVHYGGNAFPTMLEWVLQTIRYFGKRPDLQLVIRVHPGELLGNPASRQPIIAEIRRVFPVLPANVFLIPPESAISTYVVALQCNAVIIYGTKAGVELTSMGIPVVVAGEAWIRNKGVTLDADTPEEYFAILQRLPLEQRLSHAITQRARRYAYHFFFRRMIPLSFMRPDSGITPRMELAAIDDLMPGRSAGLDVICRGILEGEGFIYPAELVPTDEEGAPAPATNDRQTAHSRARGSLKIIDILGEKGELERMHAHLVKALREFPRLATAPWARASIARNVARLALASDSPIQTVRFFSDAVRAARAPHSGRDRQNMQRLIGDLWRETALGLWRAGLYPLAGWTAVLWALHAPMQGTRKAILRRASRALRHGSGDALRSDVPSSLPAKR